MTPLRRRLAAALLSASALAAPAQAQEAAGLCRGELTVTGQGVAMAVPDVLRLRFEVEAEASSPAEALADASAGMQGVFEALAAQGVAERDMATTDVNLFEVRERVKSGAPPRIVAWRAGSGVAVTLRDPSAFGAVAQAATGAGATGLGAVAFDLDDPQAAMAEARKAAVRDAMTRAREMAEAAGLSLGSVLSMDEHGGGRPMPRQFARATMAMEDASAQMPVSGGTREIVAGVGLRVELCEG
ncbi:MAG: SIMPL domain-containing protein [Pseudomonadota bacterium]